MLADALGDRFLTSPFSRLAFIFSFPMALLSLIGVWGVPNLCHNLRVVERRNAPVWPAVKQFKDPFALISRAASGPLLPFITASKCCGAARQSGHSHAEQYTGKPNDGVQEKHPHQCFERAGNLTAKFPSRRFLVLWPIVWGAAT
jgi:hypothetical protein